MNVQEIVTNKIMAELEKGIIPWQQPWKSAGMPRNFVTQKAYKGINVFLLGMMGYPEPYFLTFNQVNDLGGSVKSGEKASLVIFWNWVKKEDKHGHEEEYPVLRYYKVFNITQTRGIEYEPAISQRDGFQKLEECERIIEQYQNGPYILHVNQNAYYNKNEDYINMPLKESFINPEGYYSILFHEMIHSTGHANRLNREGVSERHVFGDEEYSKEELIAEMGSAILCAHAGIWPVTLKNSAAYIQNWLTALNNDKRLVILAAANAQKAVDHITPDITDRDIEADTHQALCAA